KGINVVPILTIVIPFGSFGRSKPQPFGTGRWAYYLQSIIGGVDVKVKVAVFSGNSAGHSFDFYGLEYGFVQKRTCYITKKIYGVKYRLLCPECEPLALWSELLALKNEPLARWSEPLVLKSKPLGRKKQPLGRWN